MAESFTVIVPVYNRERTVTACLECIRKQTYRPLHLIVVDNASTDNSLSIIREWADKHADEQLKVDVLTEPHRGACYARNRGLSVARTDYILFMDSDDMMRPQLVHDVMEAFRRNPKADIVAWKVLIHPAHGKPFTAKFAKRDFLFSHLIHAVLTTTHFAARREFLLNAGAWNDSLLAWDDLELGIRLLLNNPVITTLPKVLVDVFAHPDSITGVGFVHGAGKWEQALAAIREAFESSNHPQKEFLIRLTDYRYLNLAAAYRREGRPDLALSLYRETISRYSSKPWCRTILRLAYLQSAANIRGAYLLPKLFLRR